MILTVFHHNWWAVALRGLAAILFGVLTLLVPGLTLLVLVLLFGIYSLADGLFTLLLAWRRARISSQSRWWTLLLEGLLSVGVGIVALVWPGISSLALLYLIAIWSVGTGVLEIFSALRLRRQITGEGFLILQGVLSVLFGLALVVFPASGALVIAWLIGFYALLIGALLLALAFRLRKEQKRYGPNSASIA
jgi:uncharacterized membrane protein HdeD (DUF308 family)